MGANLTGWEPEKRTHFDEIVVNYNNTRPEYPDKLFADVIDFIGPGTKKALEIGAGTGKATFPFLEMGYNVTAVELGENMAGFLKERFKEYTNFNVLVSAFEDVLLDKSSYDLIYAASAFHWVNAEIGCPTVFDLLKSGGVFALFRYNFIAMHNEALTAEIDAVYDKFYFSYYTSKQRSIKYRKIHDDFKKPSEILANYGFEDMKDYGFKDVSLNFYDVTWTSNADAYIKRCDTLADHRSLPEENRVALYEGVKEAILAHGGDIKIDEVFQLYMGRKP